MWVWGVSAAFGAAIRFASWGQKSSKLRLGALHASFRAQGCFGNASCEPVLIHLYIFITIIYRYMHLYIYVYIYIYIYIYIYTYMYNKIVYMSTNVQHICTYS